MRWKKVPFVPVNGVLECGHIGLQPTRLFRQNAFLKACYPLLALFVANSSMGQTAITTQTGNMDGAVVQNNTPSSFAGNYNNSSTELANYANQNAGSSSTPGAAVFRTFTTNQTATGGTNRTLRPGDRFVITAYSNQPAASGIVGISFKNNTTYANVSDYSNGQVCRFELTETGGWKIMHNAGTTENAAATAGADRTLQIDITSSNTFDATIAGTAYRNLTFINAGPVQSFCIYNMVTVAAINRSNPNSFWKNASLQGRTIDFYTPASAAITGIVSNGGGENTTALSATKLIHHGGNNLTLNAANTYTGNTELDNGELWIGGTGDLDIGSTVYVGNGTLPANVAKLWLSNASGGNTLANNIVVNQGNAATREMGGLNTSGTHTFSGNITNNSTNGVNLNALNTNGTTVFLGIIAGANAVNKAGAGTIILSGQNTYTGATTISAGTTKLGASGAGVNSPLGTVAASTTVGSGAVLDLNGFTLATAENLTLNGTGISANGALANNPAATTNVTYSGLITLGSGASIVANNGTINLTNTGTITGADFGLILGGTSGGSLAAAIGTGSGSLTKQGSGTWLLSGASTYTGATTISAGIVQLSGGANRLPITSALTLANATGAALDLNSQNQTFSSLSGGGTLGGDITLGSATLTVVSAANTTFAGIISGTGGLTKQGTGTLTLDGTNTYSGTTTLSAGTLTINAASAWPATSNIYLGGGTLAFGSIATGASLGSTATAGTINLQANTIINLGAAATTFSVSFANSSAVAWDLTRTITISNWTPTAAKVIKFPTAGSLTAGQLGRINFDNYGIGAKLVLVGSEYELRPTLLYVTLATGAGNFSTAGSWINSDNPIVNDGTAYIYVQPGFTLTQDVVYNLYGAEIGGTLAMGSNAINIYTGGQFKNYGTISMTSSSNINMATGTTLVHAGSPSYSAAGNISFAGTGTITGTATLPNVTIGGAVNFGTASTIGNGSALIIAGGGSVNTNAPTYATGSTLIYNSGGTYGRSTEWSATTGTGYPYNVQVGNGVNTILDLANGGTGTARFCAGSLTISAGSTLTMNNAGNVMVMPLNVLGDVTINGSLVLSSIAPGDLYVGGNYTEAAGTVLTANERAVFFNGGTTTNQTITKTSGGNINFPYLIINKSNNGNVRLSTGTNVILSSTTNNTGLYVLQILNGNIDLNDGTLTLTGTVPNSNNVRIGGASQRRIFTTTGTGDFVVGGTFTAGSPNMNVSAAVAGSSLLFDNSVKITTAVGLDFGASGISLINATLQLNTNGFVINNAPDYGNSSILIYNNGSAGYNRNYEWRSTSGAGFPNHIVIQNNTPLSLNTIAAPADLGCSGNITIDAGSSLDMGAMAYDVLVAGNIIINGELALSTASGTTGDLRLTGDWTRGSAGTFIQNAGIVYSTGTTASQLTAPTGGETFTKFYMVKTSGGNLTLQSPVLVNSELNFGGGLINTTSTNLLTMASATSIGGTPGTSCYVNGPLSRYINDANVLLFPVGKSVAANPYRPITFAPEASTTGAADYFTATFFNANPPAGFMSGPNLQGMLKNQYWQLDRSGTANGIVKIDYVAPSGTGNWLDTYTGFDAVEPSDPENTVQIAKRSSDDDGLLLRPWSFTYSGEPSSTDFYTTYNASKAPIFTDLVNSFSYFGFGYSFSSLLPVKLLSFDGNIFNADGALSWTVSSTEDLASFELQYSSDGRSYKKLASVPFNGSTFYSYLHKNIPAGTNYYKVWIKEKNGKSYYSNTILLLADKQKTQIIGLVNSIANNDVLVKIVSPNKQGVQAVVTDASGRRINEFKSVLEAGIYQWRLNTQALSTGIYFVAVQTADKSMQTFRFVKQ